MSLRSGGEYLEGQCGTPHFSVLIVCHLILDRMQPVIDATEVMVCIRVDMDTYRGIPGSV